MEQINKCATCLWGDACYDLDGRNCDDYTPVNETTLAIAYYWGELALRAAAYADMIYDYDDGDEDGDGDAEGESENEREELYHD